MLQASLIHIFQNPANPKYFEFYRPSDGAVTRSHSLPSLCLNYSNHWEHINDPSVYFEGWPLITTTSNPSTLSQTHPELFI
jgi:hypothetical protein